MKKKVPYPYNYHKLSSVNPAGYITRIIGTLKCVPVSKVMCK